MAEAQSVDKKRKRQSDGVPKPRKKSALSQSNGRTVKVTHHKYDDEWIPVVASTPGLSIPSSTTFRTYRKPASRSSQPSELLLHSTTHPSLIYTARETFQNNLIHHVGIYDPATHQLELLPAHYVSIRSTLRREEEAARATAIAQRTDTDLTATQSLAVAFGTKKAKKAIQSLSENAITSNKTPRDASPGAVRKAIKDDPTAMSVLETMTESAATAPDRNAQQATVDAAKPRPKHNPDAKTAQEVYSPEEVVGHEMLVALRVKGWADTIAQGGDVKTGSRFVSRRIGQIVEDNDVLRLKVAKYVLVLVTFAKTLRRMKDGSIGHGKILKRQELKEKLEADSWVVDQVVKKFSDNGEMSKWQVDYLLAHIFVCVLIVDQFESDTYNIREDLDMTNKDLTKYFREIGARLDTPTETERGRMNLSKQEAEVHKIARLPVPVQFPKQRQIPRRR